MRFRLDSGSGGAALAGSIGDIFKSFATLPMQKAKWADDQRAQDAEMAYKNAQTQHALGQTKYLEQQGRTSEAQANLHAQNLADMKRHADSQSIGALLQNSAMAQGVPAFDAPQVAKYAQTGQMPGQYVQPSAELGGGPAIPAPAYYGGDTFAAIMRDVGNLNKGMAVGDKNLNSIAKAQGEYRDQALGDAVLSGALNAGKVGQSQAAVKGTKLIDNINNTGQGFNQFTGDGVTLDQGLRAIFGKEAEAGIGRTNAQAGQASAAAGASRALAGLRGTETNNAKIRGGMEALDFKAMQNGEALPSSNRVSRGADSTDAKARNSVIAAAMKKPEFGIMTPEEKLQAINTDLAVSGHAPVTPGDLTAPSAPVKTTPAQGGKNAASSAPRKVSTRAEAMALPVGTRFIDPNGVERIR
jgi:hypothetical protein